MISIIWTATREGKQVGSGVKTLTEKEWLDIHNGANPTKMVNEWNRMGILQFNMKVNLPRILWTYYTI